MKRSPLPVTLGPAASQRGSGSFKQSPKRAHVVLGTKKVHVHRGFETFQRKKLAGKNECRVQALAGLLRFMCIEAYRSI